VNCRGEATVVKAMAMSSWQRGGIMTALIGAAVLAGPVPALASPFCVQTQALPPQCMYVDAGSCNARANQLGGTCTVNPAELHVTPGLGHYCLLTSGHVSSCVYADRADCDREAQHQQGVCVQSPSRPESPGPDPYRDIRPLMAGH
jgi:hypothetical protein